MQRRAWMAMRAAFTFLTPVFSNSDRALAITLGSAAPLYESVLPSILRREWPSRQACGGAVLAVAGVVVLGARTRHDLTSRCRGGLAVLSCDLVTSGSATCLPIATDAVYGVRSHGSSAVNSAGQIHTVQ